MQQRSNLHQININQEQEFVRWKAVCIDNSFYLADPQSINKLIELQKMIMQQKQKISGHSYNRMLKQQDSFQSHNQHILKDMSYFDDGCRTQINHTASIIKQVKLQKQLLQEQQRIRQNMIKMKSRRYYGQFDGQKVIQTNKKRRNLSRVKQNQNQNRSKKQNQDNIQEDTLHQNPQKFQQNVDSHKQENAEKQQQSKSRVNQIPLQQINSKKFINQNFVMQKHGQGGKAIGQIQTHNFTGYQDCGINQSNLDQQNKKIVENVASHESQKQKRIQHSIWLEYNKTQNIKDNNQQKFQEDENSIKNTRVYSREPSHQIKKVINQAEQMNRLNKKIVFLEQKLKIIQQKQNQIEQIRQSTLIINKDQNQKSSDEKQQSNCKISNQNSYQQKITARKQDKIRKDNSFQMPRKKQLSIYRTIQQRSKFQTQNQYHLQMKQQVELQQKAQNKDQKQIMKQEIENLNKTIRQLKLEKLKKQHPQYNQLIKQKETNSQQKNQLEFENEVRNASPRLLEPNQSSQLPRPNFLIRKSIQKKQRQREQTSAIKQIIPITNSFKSTNQNKVSDRVEKDHQIFASNQKLQSNPNHPRFGRIVKNNSPIKMKYNISGISSQQEVYGKQKSSIKGQKSLISYSQAKSKSRKSSQAYSQHPISCNDTSKSMAIKRESLINPNKFTEKQSNKFQEFNQPKTFKSQQFKAYQSQQRNKNSVNNQMYPMKTLDLQNERGQELKNNKIRIRQTPTGSDFKRKLNGLTSQQISAIDHQYPNSLAKTINFNSNISYKNSNRQASLEMKGIIVNQVPINKQKTRYSGMQKTGQKSGQAKSKVMFKKVAQFDKFSQSSVDQGRKIFVLQFQEKKRANNQIIDSQPEEQQQIKPLPEIKFSNLEFPELPQVNLAHMAPKQQIQIAAQTFKRFKVKLNTKNPQQDIRMIKYKNCILFSCEGSPQKILWHNSGKFYIGGWNDNQQGNRTGEGYEYVPEKYVYKGQFSKGKRSGNGIAKYTNGTIYQGQWLEGNRHGKGKLLDKQAKYVYDGEWKDNKKDGFGTMRISQNQYYIGTFFKSVKTGHGIQVYSNGDKYKGQFANGKYQGKGKYYWSNGSSYNGQFVSGFRQGHGKWRSAKKGGDCYIGEYKKDKKEGYGRYIWANGSCFQGSFKQDTKHGKGRMLFQDSRQIKGQWSNGQLIDIQGQGNNNPENQSYYPLQQKIQQYSHQKSKNQVFQMPSKRLQSPGKIGKL